MADVAQPLARLVEELRGERTAAHARAVGFEDAVDLADTVGADAEARGGARRDRIRRGDGRVRNEIGGEQRTLCAFGQNGLVFGEEAVDFVLAVDDAELFEVFDPLEPLSFQFVDIVVVTQRFENVLVTRLGHFVNLLEVEEDVAHTHAVAADLVRIGRADALARGADFRTALRRFERSVQHAVRGQDQVRLFRDVEPLRQVLSP